MRKGDCAVYRHYDKDGNLLYVGCSDQVLRRIYMHACNSHWCQDTATITIERFGSNGEAMRAEEVAIKNELPLHNKDKKGGCSQSMYRKSSVRGVLWSFERQSWLTLCLSNKESDRFGYFDNLFEAVCARLSYEQSHHRLSKYKTRTAYQYVKKHIPTIK